MKMNHISPFVSAGIALFLLMGVGGRLFAQSSRGTGLHAHDRSLSALYTEYASDAFRAGLYEKADEYARAALVFHHASPDALYIRAETERRNERFASAAEFYTRALLYDTWLHFEAKEARFQLAKIQYRSGDLEAAYHMLSARYPTLLEESDEAALYVKILSLLGFEDRAKRTVRTAQGRFPQDEELQVLRIELDEDYRRQARSQVLAGDAQRLFHREAYRKIIEVEYERGLGAVSDMIRPLLDAYRKRWKEDRFLKSYRTWLSLKLKRGESAVSVKEAFAELFAAYNGFSGGELALLRGAVAEDELSAALSGFTAFSGIVLFDENGDGFDEKRVRYESGVIYRMEIDTNQDGRTDIAVSFSDSRPAVYERFNPSVKRGSYGEYPNLVEVEFEDADSRVLMDLVPYEVDLDIFIEDEWNSLEVPQVITEIGLPPLNELLPFAARIDQKGRGSLLAYDALAGRSIVYPVAGTAERVIGDYEGENLRLRRRDIDGDGQMEITEQYLNGKLLYVVYDGNGNDRPEYRESYEDGERVRQWDVNEDGIYDYEMRIPEK